MTDRVLGFFYNESRTQASRELDQLCTHIRAARAERTNREKGAISLFWSEPAIRTRKVGEDRRPEADPTGVKGRIPNVDSEREKLQCCQMSWKLSC